MNKCLSSSHSAGVGVPAPHFVAVQCRVSQPQLLVYFLNYENEGGNISYLPGCYED